MQDMACDTFIKIAQKCRRHFVQVQVGEVMPFIDEILNNINTIICDLQPQQVSRDLSAPPQELMCPLVTQRESDKSHCSSPQVHTFYEAVGYMIGAQTDQAVQELLIEKYMLLPNQVWDSIIQQATKVRAEGRLSTGVSSSVSSVFSFNAATLNRLFCRRTWTS